MTRSVVWLSSGVDCDERVMFDPYGDVVVRREQVGDRGLSIRPVQRRDTAIIGLERRCRVHERVVIETQKGPLIVVYQFRAVAPVTTAPVRALLEIRLANFA